MDNLAGLNTNQKEAVLHTEGPLLIIAGAGAGKTKTVTHRIYNLITKGVYPSSILAITFTNKAAGEMRSRVMSLLNETGHETNFYGESPIIKTFHSLGVMLVKENHVAFGLPRQFSIADEDDTISIIKNALTNEGLDTKQYDPKRIKNLISKQKNKLETAEMFAETAQGFIPKIVSRVWLTYEHALRDAHSLDFDDLIVKPVLLLQKNPEVRAIYHKRFRYIHVDEYQDTNEAQYTLTKLLTNSEHNICVVGDGDQNIYGWRGANVRNLLNFEHDYPEAKIILLEENYRSTKVILEAANEVINKNKIRKDKNLFTNNSEGEKISLFEAYNEEEEAMFVAHTVQKLIEAGEDESKMAVLYRANFQSRVIEEAFLHTQVPYQVLGTRFFDRKEVKDILAYAYLAFVGNNPMHLKRALATPTRGIGKVGLVKILSNELSSLPPKTKIAYEQFQKLISDIKTAIDTTAPSLAIKFIIEKSGTEELYKNGGDDGVERLENLGELITLASKFDGEELGKGFEMFLEEASLMSDQDNLKEEKKGVRLMTVHASKGLEFSHVFITGLEQDLFPHQKPREVAQSEEDSEEERRLFYVALTRAEKKLYLSYATFRTMFGSKQINAQSEFLIDIPEHLIERAEKDSTTPWTGKTIYID